MLEWIADPSAWVALATLTLLEIVLGIDNIIFISILVGRLPEAQRQKARILGLGLAMGTRILLLRLITWIGRWSMLDLFVISLTMSLINRDQLLAFTMGPAAVYFGGAVILTILAVEWLDSRLLWDAHESGNARFAD